MGAIDSFISSMNKSEGFARAANYEVVFKFPVGISVPSRGQQLSMHCNTITWPGHDLQVQARKHASEPTRNLVQSHAFEGTIDAIFYLSAFYLLTFVVNKLPIAVVYATWSGLGIFTIAILGYIFFKQTLAWQAVLGLFLIVIGVVLVNAYNIKTI